MGAFDTYAATARCPRCQDLHEVAGQTKFFQPDFGGLCGRDFVPGKAQPLYFGTDDLAGVRVWDDEWLRVREPLGGPGLDLLADFDALFGCDCGAGFAVVLHFVLTEGRTPTGTLREISLREHDDEGATDVDFAELPPDLWTGDYEAFKVRAAVLAASPVAERQARLRAVLRARFARAAVDETHDPWTWIAGPVRCERCGDTSARREMSLLTHQDHTVGFFGPGWTGGEIGPEARIDCDLAWLDEDVDRGYYTRLRHPVPSDRLTMVLRQRSQGCRCAAGFGAIVLYFRRDPAGLTLTRLGLRVVRGREDLADIDFAESPHNTRDRSPLAYPQRLSWTREAALAAVLSELAWAASTAIAL